MSKRNTFPSTWMAVPLGNIAEFEMGQAPPGDACNHEGIGTLFVKAGEFGVNRPIEREWTTKPLKFGRRGDVFICVVGATCGKLNLGADCAIGRSVAAIRSSNVLDQHYLYYQLQPQVMALRSASAGSAQGVLNRKQLSDIEIRIAPINEQCRIVAKIEELFSDLDAGVAALNRAKANLKRYRASILKAAVEGKLTEEWRARHPATEPASSLLARILKERRQKWEADQLAKFAAAKKAPPKNWREKYVEPTPPDTSGLPDLPNGWCWASVEQVASNEVYSITDGPFGSNLKSEHYQQSGPRVIRLQNIGDGDFNMVDSHISVTHFEKLQRHSVKAGDVVTAMLGEHLPRACLVPENIAPAIVKADCVKITVNRRLILPSYMVASLNAHSTRVRTLPKIAGVGRPRLNLEKLRPLPIPLPPILEQLEIEQRLSEAFSQIQASHIHIEKSIIRASRLRQSILKQAFEGKLVPQDPTDEPASVLLERLRASKSVHEGSGKPTAYVRTRGRRAKSKQASPPGEEAER